MVADVRKPICTAIAHTDGKWTLNNVLVVRRIGLQLFDPSISDSGRLGLDTRLTNDATISGGHGGSDLSSSSNMRINRKFMQARRYSL
jgi:hypothetical protein